MLRQASSFTIYVSGGVIMIKGIFIVFLYEGWVLFLLCNYFRIAALFLRSYSIFFFLAILSSFFLH